MGDNNGCDATFKVVIVGDDEVGKSNFLGGVFRREITSSLNSLVVDIGTLRIQVDICDPTGFSVPEMKTIFSEAVAIILVYDVTNETSFLSLNKWMDMVKNYSSHFIEVGIMGNIANHVAFHHPRQVSTKRGADFVQQWHLRVGGFSPPLIQEMIVSNDIDYSATIKALCKTIHYRMINHNKLLVGRDPDYKKYKEAVSSGKTRS